MSDSNLLNKSAVELKNLIQNKKISSIELTKLALEKIEETNHITNAFLTITHDLAINSAKLVDEKIAKGDPVGLLGGVPTSIKDLEPVKGYRTTKGSLFLENSVSEIDQLGVERIKNEDGVILGKTNVPEFGASGGTENKLGDDCRNPWNLEHTPGGSSGGTAAAVASGVHPFGQGSDGGGSIRIPSSFSGIYGIKGTQGRVPRRHASRMSWHPVNYSCMGPMSWYVKDSALLLQAMSGPHPEAEPGTIATPAPDFLKNIDDGIKGKKIAWSSNLNCRSVDPEVIKVNKQAMNIFEKHGAIVEDLEFNIDLNEYEELDSVLSIALNYANNKSYYEQDPSKLMPHVRNTIERGKLITSEQYIQALTKLYELRDYISSLFINYDFIATPTSAFTANRCDEKHIVENGKLKIVKITREDKFIENDLDYSSWNFACKQFTALFNWSGNPGASIPSGFTKYNMPVGLQIIGAKENEVGVLQASRVFELEKPWQNKRPII